MSDVVEKFVEVGDRIAIEGEMYSQEWEKDGVKRTSMRVRCEKLELLGDSKKEGTQTPANEES